MKIALLFILLAFTAKAQQEITLASSLEKVTLFFQGAQIQHQKTAELSAGRQIVVFEKLTDFMDPNSVQVKSSSSDLTILSVSTRKNFEDLKMTNSELTELNSQKKDILKKEAILRDEYAILENDKNLLHRNSELKGEQTGVKVSELKDAYAFMHDKMMEIKNRQTMISRELQKLKQDQNKIEQEITTRQNKPVTNYTEIVVEIDVEQATSSNFVFNYISPKASWSPYYDLRSDGIGKPVRLEAKALVNQSTGIEWKDIDLILSTNDPYQNSREPELKEWYLNYNNYPPQKYSGGRTIPVFDYSGQKLRGEAIDASTGEPLAFAKITFSNSPNVFAITDFDGKFEVIVPKGETYISANYIGYYSVQKQILSPYVKFMLQPENIQLPSAPAATGAFIGGQQLFGAASSQISLSPSGAETYFWNGADSVMLGKVEVGNVRKKNRERALQQEGKYVSASEIAVTAVKKDLRVEYTIQSKMSVPSNGQDQRVQIATYVLPASYEYHAVPKLDPSAYLVAQVSGWEKLNLLNGESNLYFDGTYIGKTYVDANSTKDTLTFSLGKDNKIQVERTKIQEKSKTKTIGSRQKVDLAWEIKVKNNGGALIPILIKDQFPISTNDDIKVKRGEFSEGKIAENSGIITWNFNLGQGQSKVVNFNYSVDYRNGGIIYLE